MEKSGTNYRLASLGDVHQAGRVTLHDKLALTGTEISVNELPAGVAVPFVHAHKQNEEVYIILEGKGRLYIDGEEINVEKGDVLRIDPAAARCFKADGGSPLSFICIQAKANSLTQFTETDGYPVEVRPSWVS